MENNTHEKPKRQRKDVNQVAHGIVGRIIARSESPQANDQPEAKHEEEAPK